MTNQITDVSNYFSTTLSAAVSNTSLIYPVASIGVLTSPCYIIINPDTPGSTDNTREVIFANGSFTSTTFSSLILANRGLNGAAKNHDLGSPVTVTPIAEHIDDLNDRVTNHAHTGGTAGVVLGHGSLSGLLGNHHTNLSAVDGSRAFTGPVAGISTTAAHAATTLATKDYIDARQPTGAIQMFAAAAAPTGWLLCDGTVVSRTTYAALFAVIGTTYGVGDGTTTFGLPDMRERFPVGVGATHPLASIGGLASVTLTEAQIPGHTHTGPSHTHTGPSHTHTGPSHTHSIDPPSTATTSDSHTHTISGLASDGSTGSVNYDVGGHSQTKVAKGISTDAHSHTVNIAGFTSGAGGTGNTGAGGTGATGASGTAATGSTGGSTAHENRPPYLSLNFIIRT